jgi:hypothetical protein
MRREHSGPRPDDAGYLDRGRPPSLRWSPGVLAPRYFSGPALVPAEPQAGEVRNGGAPMGEMKRAIALENQQRLKQDRFASTLVISASIIAAVRLARDDISRPSPRLSSVVGESVALARMILDRVVR